MNTQKGSKVGSEDVKTADVQPHWIVAPILRATVKKTIEIFDDLAEILALLSDRYEWCHRSDNVNRITSSIPLEILSPKLTL